MRLILAFTLITSFATASLAQNGSLSDSSRWDPRFGVPGIDGTVVALELGPDGELYAGGKLASAGTVLASGLVVWDGESWTNLDDFDGPVHALAVDEEGRLYAGGAFTTIDGLVVNGIAMRYNGEWSSLNGGLAGEDYVVSALEVAPDGSIFVGGRFAEAGDVAAANVARWDGEAWHPLGTGVAVDESSAEGVAFVRALAFDSQGDLYVGGHFTSAGEVTTWNIAAWDGEGWRALGAGLRTHVEEQKENAAIVETMAADEEGSLFVGGSFSVTNQPDGSILGLEDTATWDGERWYQLGTDLHSVRVLHIGPDGSLYASAGQFPSNHTGVFQRIDSEWSILGSTFGRPPAALAQDREAHLIAGGSFRWHDDMLSPGVVRWSGSAWQPFSQSAALDGGVLAIAMDSNGALYVGGSFTTHSGGLLFRIARWTGERWEELGAGIGANDVGSGNVHALAIDRNGRLIVGGSFLLAGTSVAHRIAVWSDSTWTALASHMEPEYTSGRVSYVRDIALHGDTVYVGGAFSKIEDAYTANIGMWDGSDWKILGDGVDGPVTDIATSPEGILYAAGDFTRAGEVQTDGFARWDGAAWSRMPDGVSGYVHDLHMDAEGKLYVAGDLKTSEGTQVAIAIWDGGEWSAVDSPFLRAGAITTDDDGRLYAAGYRIAIRGDDLGRLDDDGWSLLSESAGGTHVNDPIHVIAAGGDDVYVGGFFSNIAGRPSYGFAHWNANASFPPLDTAVEPIPKPVLSDALLSIFPNPTAAHATIALTSARHQVVRIDLFDLLGRHVQQVYQGAVEAGETELPIDVSYLADGLYLARIVGDGLSQSQPFIVVKQNWQSLRRECE